MFASLQNATRGVWATGLRILLTLAVATCARQSPRSGSPAAPAGHSAPSGATTASAHASAAEQGAEWVAAPHLKQHFDRESLRGAAVLWEPAQGPPRCHGGSQCTRGYLPASTFKIPHALIALETNVVTGEAFTLKWDQKLRWAKAWNRDHDLRSAFRHSVVWYFQEVARRIGPARMQHWVTRLGYGNQNVGGELDMFWLNGELRISALGQVRFLRRLAEGSLPVSDRARRIVTDLMLLESGQDWAWRGKTGATGPDVPDHPDIGWLVGWVERGDRRIYHAILILERPAHVSMQGGLRERVTRNILQAEQLL
jgi:beta-lactamase class D